MRRELSPAATAAVVALLGFAVGLAGDACHVASGTTRYEWTGVPEIWQSRAWFPVLLTGAVLLAAWAGERSGLPAARTRSRADAITGAALVLALYALTAVLKGQPVTVSVVLTGALAVAVWSWWDPSPGAFADRGGRGCRRSARRDRGRVARRGELRAGQRRARRRRAVAPVPVLRGRSRRLRAVVGRQRSLTSGPRS